MASVRGLFFQVGVTSFTRRRLAECKNCLVQYYNLLCVLRELLNQQNIAIGAGYFNQETKTTSWDDPRQKMVVVEAHEDQNRFNLFILNFFVVLASAFDIVFDDRNKNDLLNHFQHFKSPRL